MAAARIPVTLISGFLGAGKTTLVNHLLGERTRERIGVIVNEFGEVGVDGELILADENPLIEITNGCVCCTVRKDLSVAVNAMLDPSGDRLDRLIIETSGLADPAPVLQTFLADPDMLRRAELESVITLVDAKHVSRHLDDPIVREQIAFADVIVLNKVDAVDREVLDGVSQDVRKLNPTAAVVETNHSKVASSKLLGTRRFSLPNTLALEPGLLDGDEHVHQHDDTIQSFCLAADAPLDGTRFNRWINRVVQASGNSIMRTKGVLALQGEARRYHFHSVHMLLDCTPGSRWNSGERRHSKLVFIGRSLDFETLRKEFLDCVASPLPSLI
ncbi:MAG: GTP-binding protein [Gammaproteobacteria bacterium]